ncbi:MAG: hypothetical protein Q9159_002721 [Coniocarpon cinnabarinum]
MMPLLNLMAAAIAFSADTASAQNMGEGPTTANGNAGLSWQAAQSMAAQLVAQMTPDEQNNITFGVSPNNGCSGVSGSAPRLNFSGLCLSDAGNGLRATDLVTGFASGVSVAASWNVDLAYERARYMGAEFRRKGVHVINGPVVGPLGRIALDGRAWEGFGADPYLAGVLANVTVGGLQESVITAVKHYIGNEQETNRMPNGVSPSISAEMDDQTLHEVYLWPFQDAVHAGAGSVMSSYNRLNGTYASSNNYTLNQVLKEDLAFPGFVVSDWGAQHDGTPSANAGLDMAMPNSLFWENNALVTATQNGSLSSGRLANMAQRILAAWYYIFDGPVGDIPLGVGLPADNTAPHTLVEGRDPASKPSTLQSAVEGHVLLKNTNNALPLKRPRFLSLFGYDATVAPTNNPSSSMLSLFNFGLQSYDISVADLIGVLTGNQASESATHGTLISGGGSGANTASYWSDPYSAIQAQAYEDDTYLRWDFESTTPDVSVASDACLVFINEGASEGFDRSGLNDLDSDKLVTNVANKCANTIVVIHNVWIRTVESWIDHPNVTALLFAHLPGQDSGRALVEVLYGRQSPSGRLPYTVAKSAFDYGPLLQPCRPLPGDLDPRCYFEEGVNIDYRYFLEHGIEPRFAFGEGLTYSEFGYQGLNVQWLEETPPISPPNPDTVAPGGLTSLFDNLARATFTVTNTGSVAAAEVSQLYLTFPDSENNATGNATSTKALRGFKKTPLQPGKSATVSLDLTRRDLSRWNTQHRSWELQMGRYQIAVGRNALDEALRGQLER